MICEREGILNDDGYHKHHCFFRSEYKKDDWDGDWNIEPVYATKHIGGPKAIHGGNKVLDNKLKTKALARYDGKYRDELEAILRRSL